MSGSAGGRVVVATAERSQFARFDVLDRCRQVIDGSVYLTTEQIGDHGRGAAARHVKHFDARRHLEEFAVRSAPDDISPPWHPRT
jgi:archaellum biogenesis ATPase FlaH